MNKYKIRVSIILLLSICLFQYACKDSSFTNIENIEHLENIGDEHDPDDPDEIGYAVDTVEPFALEERASSFKIIQVITNDSLPIFRPDGSGKKQKFGKRQIVSTTAKTRFFLKGYGFKPQSDSSNVKAYIKNVEQPNVDVISWSDTLVTVDFPILTSQLLIEKTFSIKFKIFRANDKAGRTNTTRVRSKSCISSTQAQLVLSNSTTGGSDTCTNALNAAIHMRQSYLNMSKTVGGEQLVTAQYIYQRGDILIRKGTEPLYATVIKVLPNNRAEIKMVEESLGEACPFNSKRDLTSENEGTYLSSDFQNLYFLIYRR